MLHFEWDDQKAASNFLKHGVSFDEAVKNTSTKMADQEIPELKREQLGKGIRGKYLKNFVQGSNVVVLQPEIQKAFPTSEAVNKALASMLAFAKETQGLTGRPSRPPRKRTAV